MLFLYFSVAQNNFDSRSPCRDVLTMRSDIRRNLDQLIAELAASTHICDEEGPRRFLTYGSFFSGMECPLTALEMAANTEIDTPRILRAEFACDINKHCRAVIAKNFRHRRVYSDITTVNIKNDLVPVDLFWSSAPCQDFSKNGKRQGALNHRGRLYRYHCRYINYHKPNAWILEQVPSFKEDIKYRREYQAQLRSLKSSKIYSIEEHILDTQHFGIPQRRRRLYIIGVKISKLIRQPHFPGPRLELGQRPSNLLRLEDLIDNVQGTDNDIPTTSVPVTNLFNGLERAQTRFGVNPLKHLIVMDLFGSRVNLSRGRAPTITATRASSGGYWLSTKCRFTNKDELMRLQGIPPHRYEWKSTTTERQIGHMIGNGVSVNVACHLMTEIFASSMI